MKCDQARALSTPALDNELTVEQSALFNSHIDECEKCRSAWDSALHIRTGVKDILKSFPSTNDLESKIKHNLNLVEKDSSPLWTNPWVLAAACILPMILVFAFLNSSSFQNLPGENKSDSIAQKIPGSTTNRPLTDPALTVAELIDKTSHYSKTPPNYQDGGVTSSSINLNQKTDVGFPLLNTKLVAYELGGAEMLTTRNKNIVRMCFKSKGSDICVDCYQAPAGVISSKPDREQALGDKVVSTSRVGNVNLVMFSKQGVDVVYASALPENELLKLVQPNV